MRSTRAYSIIFLLLLTKLAGAQHKTYYVSPSGNDANSGATTAAAWQTLTKVNAVTYQPGDQVLFEGGQEFPGTLTPSGSGTGVDPVVFSSYGTGKATINGADGRGFFGHNIAGLELRNLVFKGSGPVTDTADGVYFSNDQLAALDHIVVDNVEAYGFRKFGIILGTSTAFGYSNVSVTHAYAHDNGGGGITIFAGQDNYLHQNIYIAYSKAFNNTGNGIVVSSVNNATIEYCEAFHNGNDAAGPVGIWTYNGKNVTIQFCESHHNLAGTQKDGGGFDIDGGCQNSAIQYCYSHDNEGAGYAFFEYGSSNLFANNIIRYNISQNDGRKNSYGALYLWAVDAAHPITNSVMYNNTVYQSTTGVVNGTPAVLALRLPYMSGIKLVNNIFYAADAVNFISATDAVDTTKMHLMYNDYYSVSAVYNFQWNGSSYNSFSTWQSAATGQEMNGAVQTAKLVDPQLTSPGAGGTVHPADGTSLANNSGYHLASTSPMIDAAIEWTNMGARDYYGTVVPNGAAFDIGAAEFTTQSTLGVSIIRFSGNVQNGRSVLSWQVGQETNLLNYQVQRASDGRNFHPVGTVVPSGAASYSFTDVEPFAGTAVYYRLAMVERSGAVHYSSTLQLPGAAATRSTATYQPGSGLLLYLAAQTDRAAEIHVYDLSGRSMLQRSIHLQQGLNLIPVPEALNWPAGIYVLKSDALNGAALKVAKQ
jgi:Right handed beta helix region